MRLYHVRNCLLSLALMVDSAWGFASFETTTALRIQKNGSSKTRFPSTASMHDQSEMGIEEEDDSNSFEMSTTEFSQQQQQQNNNLQGITSPTTSASWRAKARGKPRIHNPAMGDISFLRKRTSDLLSLTSKGELTINGNEGIPLSRNMKVDLKTFNFLIDAWAFSGELEAADQAMELLARMEELQNLPQNQINICPDVRSYTKVINALSRSMRPDAGEIGEELLDKMEYLSESGVNPSAKPNTFTYTAVIEGYANSGVEGSAQKTEEILERMIKNYEYGNPDVRPNARCFNAAISAFAKSGYPGSAERAEYLFHRMEGLYMSGLEDAKPNTFNYNSLITALANSAEEGSAERAADVLRRMEACYASGDIDCKPTTVSFNAVIDAYAKSGNDDAAQKAENVVRRMEYLFESGEDIKPNTRSFNSVINAWAKSGQEDSASRAQELLNYMGTLYETGNKAVRPDRHSYCTVINAWARSSKAGKAEYAKSLYRAMEQAYIDGNEMLKPNVVVINSVMNACAYTHGDLQEQSRAMEIAHNVFKKLEKNPEFGSPDQVTYGTFLKVCANQMPDCGTRQQIIDVIFRKCASQGQVGNLVLQQIKLMGPSDLYYRLLGRTIEEEIRMEDLPREWWSNVVEGKWRRQRNR